MKLSELQNDLEAWVQARPVSHWGFSKLERPLSLEFYKNWLKLGYHSEMQYLEDHLPEKADPQKLGTKLKSALVMAFPYLPHPEGQDFPLKHLKLAQYAQGQDYHFWIKRHLQDLVTDLQKKFPQDQFLVLTDSGPLMERDLAYRAGLGWIGKNSCLIHPKKGSLFLIGEILTSLDFQNQPELTPDHCGKCQACIEVCPTQALKSPRLLDANLCISYWTIESRKLPPENLRKAMGDWFFGCDLCQTVCPWNQKPIKAQDSLQSTSHSESGSLTEELRWILASSGKKIEKQLKGTALMRAGSFGLKRNALLVAGNRGLKELRPEVSALLTHPKLQELAIWTLSQWD